jgi:quinol monooxygenase YgiN
MKNGQSRETGNIGYTRHKTKTNKTKKHNTENWKDERHGLHQQLGSEASCHAQDK